VGGLALVFPISLAVSWGNIEIGKVLPAVRLLPVHAVP
jgi:hypothetical protein